jgi:predicted DCC family thiol-disulfide oxidoreductase YuxK
MADTRTGGTPGAQGSHLVLYDGVCGLCSRLTHFLLTHDHRAVFVYASLQSATGRATVQRFGGNPDELASFYVIADHRSDQARILGRSRAALFVARELGWPWRAAVLLRVLPPALLNLIYDLVARTRYRLFGRLDHCIIPRPEFRHRFIDS